MTYTEWRDELKNNLLCVSESERKRVLDYYAEAYADRREAGYSEHEIIEQFGAPYDAAQRILTDSDREPSDEFFDDREDRKQPERRKPEKEESDVKKERDTKAESEPEEKSEESRESSGNRGLFILLCIIFCGPLFGLLMAMVGLTIGFSVAPFAVLISSFAVIGGGIGSMVGGDILGGFATIGVGLMVCGVGIILVSVFTKIIGLIWKLWRSFFKWIKSLFGIKEKEKAK